MKTLTTYQLCSITTIQELQEVVEEVISAYGTELDLDFYEGELVVYEAEPEAESKLRQQLDALQHELFVTKQQLHKAHHQLDDRGSEILKLKHELVNLRVSRGIKDL